MPSDVAQAITENLLFWLINIYKAHNCYLTVTFLSLILLYFVSVFSVIVFMGHIHSFIYFF